MIKNKYLVEKSNRTKLYLRICLGVQQLIFRPYLNILVAPLLVLLVVCWKFKERLLSLLSVPQILFPIYQCSLHIMAIVIPLILFVYLLETIGTLTARKDEGNLTLALKEQDLRNGVPLLIKKKKIKGTDVTVREFYSNIPFHTWIESKEAIADSMNVHFVEPAIEYGGKKKNNGKRIVIYTAKGRKPVKRGELYDEEL